MSVSETLDAVRIVAGLSLIPRWNLERLAGSAVLVVGGGFLGDEIGRALRLLGVGQITEADLATCSGARYRSHGRGGGGSPSRRAGAGDRDPALDTLLQGRSVPTGTNIVIHCADDGWSRALVRRACGRDGIPWIDVRLAVFHGSLATHLPHQVGPDSFPAPACPAPPCDMPFNPAMASVMASLAAQEAAKILLAGEGFPNLAGRTCLVDGQMYAMRLLNDHPA